MLSRCHSADCAPRFPRAYVILHFLDNRSYGHLEVFHCRKSHPVCTFDIHRFCECKHLLGRQIIAEPTASVTRASMEICRILARGQTSGIVHAGWIFETWAQLLMVGTRLTGR